LGNNLILINHVEITDRGEIGGRVLLNYGFPGRWGWGTRREAGKRRILLLCHRHRIEDKRGKLPLPILSRKLTYESRTVKDGIKEDDENIWRSTVNRRRGIEVKGEGNVFSSDQLIDYRKNQKNAAGRQSC